MHRSLMAMAAVAAIVGAATLARTPASAASAAAAPIAAPQLLHPVQFYGAGPHYGDDGWERRRQWREWRRERDEARIAEAARREAYQIEAERQQRRAWRRAQREQQYGYGPTYGYGHHRSW
jgi:Spy/CpxP family protein refolding chaperone